MNRKYFHYEKWEDFKNGMYSGYLKENETELIKLAKELLSNDNDFFETSLKVLEGWKISSDENLSNVNCNRRAWIGQSACCFRHKVPETITRMAWGELTEIQRNNANKIADKIINIYENKDRRIRENMGEQMLF